MRRLEWIDARLERWTRWLQSSGVAVAIYARKRQRVDCEQHTDGGTMIHEEEWETNTLVDALGKPGKTIVHAVYLGRVSVGELARAVGVSAEIEKVGTARVVMTNREIAEALGVTQATVSNHLCRVHHEIARMIDDRRTGRDRRATKQARKIVRIKVEGRTIASALHDADGELLQL